MSAYWGTEDKVGLVAAAYDFADSTAAVSFKPGKPADVKRVVGVVTEATAGSSVVTIAVADADGSTNATTLGTFTVPASIAIGGVFTVEIAGVDPDAVTPSGEHSQVAEVTMGRVDGYQTNLPGVAEVDVGQVMTFTSDGGGSAGIANLYVEYVEQGNNPERNGEPTVIDFTRS